MKTRNLFKATIVSLVMLGAGMAQAQELYIGGNLALLDAGSGGEDVSLDTAYGRFGAFFNENFSLEGRLGIGVRDDSINVFGFERDVSLEYLFSVMGRAGFELSDVVYPYFALGYSQAEVDVEGFNTDSESDVSYGLGADFSITDTLSINVEYTNYIDKNDVELDGFTVGAVLDL